ncbi:hypothetical protein MLP_11370 [Microlunatus phosphovorus NM-1]|uniref:Uncharacterized protein n=1 Tax=Microlunatus phosphovorus (strain ATCC 700054 / DSM 10555 / JCM 9379 / NBRC 101784 / NCIMB 13414 / VKM Ac-1990 / NM-1) TaxID=1032480 RepID=F5XNN7_MICPN|nr:hypothetical protein [Microlunatus phosphovorus]BAK34151.1 hypothetical protein MLP_11370 [Microlunatus phosphovorus NM-1]
MIEIVNLTPHEVTVMPGDAEAVTFPASGEFARVREHLGDEVWVATEGGRVPVRQLTYDEQVDDLPDPSPGVLYLVSRLTALSVRRDDLIFPQGELRDDNGQIIGCRGLGTFADPASIAGGE